MKVLVACEFSGIVREAFKVKGHEAVSCDYLPSERNGEHHMGDVRELIGEYWWVHWDLMIAFPPCTYLANSGVRWLQERPDRWAKMEEAAQFFKILLSSHIPRIAIENPIPHKYALGIIGRKYDQIIQPWWFGNGETKATCLWLKNLPPLMASLVHTERYPRIHLEPPSPERSKNRSRTYHGIAEAMAEQWGRFLISNRGDPV